MQLKEKRDAAILEKHKEGMSERAIAKMFNMSKTTVHDVIVEAVGNRESRKPTTPRGLHFRRPDGIH